MKRRQFLKSLANMTLLGTTTLYGCRGIAGSSDVIHEAKPDVPPPHWPASDTGSVLTGVKSLDDLTGGLRAGELIVLASRPRMGRTSLVMNAVEHLALGQGVPVYLFTDGRLDWRNRLLSSVAGVNDILLTCNCTEEDTLTKLKQASKRINASPLNFIYMEALGVEEIVSFMRSALDAHAKPGLVVVDHAWLRSSNTASPSQMAASYIFFQNAKQMAIDLNRPVLVVSKMAYELDQQDSTRPSIDFLPAQHVAEHADTVILLYRDELYDIDSPWEGTAEVTVAKCNGGKRGTAVLGFDDESCHFLPLYEDIAVPRFLRKDTLRSC